MLQARSWQVRVPSNGANGFSWNPFRECLSDVMIRESLGRHASRIRGRLLDLGCGDRRYQEVFGSHTASWIGLDWPASGDPRGGHADVHGNVLQLPFATGTFDTVLCTQVLEHVPDPLQLFREAHRVLRPEGSLLLTAPQYNVLHEEPRDFFRFTCYGLRHLAETSGFRIQTIEPIGGFIALFAFICVIHVAPLRIRPICGAWQAAAKKLDRMFFRPKDCMGYVLAAEKIQGRAAPPETVTW